MPYCPACQHEREPGAKKCPICDGKLVNELPVPDFTDVELAVVASYPQDAAAETARRKLGAHGVESIVIGEALPATDTSPTSATHGVRVMVRKEEAGWARRVLVER